MGNNLNNKPNKEIRMQPDETVFTPGSTTTVPPVVETPKTDNDAILEAVKELTKAVGEVKAQMKTLEETSAKWWKANRGF